MSREVPIYGIHAIQAVLSDSKRKIYELWLHEDKLSERLRVVGDLAQALNIPIHRVSTATFKKKFGDVVHQGAVLIAAPLPEYTESDLPNLLDTQHPLLILILDNLTDPHNLGACLRTANACGVDLVIVPKDKSASPKNPVVSKVASGATESTICLSVTNLSRTMEQLQQAGVWIYGAAGEVEKNIWQINFTGSTALVMGSEGEGLRRLTREHCDGLFSIPMAGMVESLNVSVATGVCLYEVVRQRGGY